MVEEEQGSTGGEVKSEKADAEEFKGVVVNDDDDRDEEEDEDEDEEEEEEEEEEDEEGWSRSHR